MLVHDFGASYDVGDAVPSETGLPDLSQQV